MTVTENASLEAEGGGDAEFGNRGKGMMPNLGTGGKVQLAEASNTATTLLSSIIAAGTLQGAGGQVGLELTAKCAGDQRMERKNDWYQQTNRRVSML